MTCPSEDTLLQYVGGYLSQQQGDQVEHHLDQCSNCRQLLCSFARDGSVSSSGRLTLSQVSNAGGSFPSSGKLPTAGSIERGTLLDRYLVIECLGLGGMGVVYKGYDPDLDRKVALKLLHPTKVLSEQAEQLLVREARLMAKVIHPNVVMVYEIAQANGCSLVAMEFVKGKNLSQWIDEKERTWQEILSVLVEAGHGLSAAHRAGLVHRDFKPTNVMVTQEGHAKVADFGLAGIAWKQANSGAWTVPVNVSAQSGDASLGEGGLIGSPAYMSAAQFEGKKADTLSDQFSFCVTLYEALFQQHPFRNMSFDELRNDVLAGKVRPPPRHSKVPNRIQHAVLRGLSLSPKDRFETMDDLLHELERRPIDRVRWIVAALLILILGAGGVWLGLRLGQQSHLCENALAKWDNVWDLPRQNAMRASFVATDSKSAEISYQKAAAIIDAYVQEWNHVFKVSCEATHRTGEQSEQLLDLRQQCLERRRGEVKALVDLLTKSADRELVNRAIEATQRLTSLGGCSDAQALRAVLPPPEDARIREQVADLQRRLDEAGVYLKTENAVIGLPLAETLVEEAKKVDHPPVLAEAWFLLAELRTLGGTDLPVIEKNYLSAALAASEGKNDLLLAQALTMQLWVVSKIKNRPQQALELSKIVGAVIARLGSDQRKRVDALFYSILARAYWAQQDTGKAREEFQKSYEMFRQLYGEDHVETLHASLALAIVIEEMGDQEEAAQRYEQLIRASAQVLGPRHPEVAKIMGGESLLFMNQGKYAQAEERLRSAIGIFEENYGRKNLVLGYHLGNLGSVLNKLGKNQEARIIVGQALEIFQELLGPNDRSTHIASLILADVALAEGNLEQALLLCQKSRAGLENMPGAKNDQFVGESLACISEVYRKKGRCDLALKFAKHAMDLVAAGKSNHRSIVVALQSFGRCAFNRKDTTAAREILGRASKALEQLKASSYQMAEARFALAQALWVLNTDKKRALSLGEQAQETYANLGKDYTIKHEEVSRWLKDRQEKSLPR